MKENKINKGELCSIRIIECKNCGFSEMRPDERLRNNDYEKNK